MTREEVYVRARGASHGKSSLALLKAKDSTKDISCSDGNYSDNDETQGNDPELCQLRRRQAECYLASQQAGCEYIVVLHDQN